MNAPSVPPSSRVVITGLGWVTSLGCGVDDVFADLLAGKSGISNIERFPTQGFSAHFAGEIKNFTPRHVDEREAKRLDPFTQYAVDAAIDAWKQSGLDMEREDPFRVGVIIGSGIGGLAEFEVGARRMEEKGAMRISPFMVPKMMCNAASGNVSILLGTKGPNTAVATACASAGHAIGDACDAIRRGIADVMIAGGSEAALTRTGMGGFMSMRALSTRNDDPTGASRPFDADRDGFVLAEGAGILVLESYEHAKARGATILAELLGHGQSSDGSHITAPDEQGRGAAYAMRMAMLNAGVQADAVDYINAHGTSTPLGDKAETVAVKSVFDEHAKKLAMSSTKSALGHLLGASGGVEAVITVKALQTGDVPPTINYQTPDPDCDLDYVPNEARTLNPRVALSNSFGFGGHNVSLVFGKAE